MKKFNANQNNCKADADPVKFQFSASAIFTMESIEALTSTIGNFEVPVSGLVFGCSLLYIAKKT